MQQLHKSNSKSKEGVKEGKKFLALKFPLARNVSYSHKFSGVPPNRP